jgi:hypothetical protein
MKRRHNMGNDRGFEAVVSPAEQSLATESEDDDAFTALREDLSPGEAQEVLDTMRPLSPAERQILDDIPELEGMTRVDDAEQEESLINRARSGYRAMDQVLDDAVYGDTMTDEEKLERIGQDTDLGWGLPGLSSIKKLTKRIPGGKFVGRLASTPLNAAKWAGKKVASTAMKFVPGRDAGKAKLVKGAYSKLLTQHANWLGLQDQKAGRRVQPASVYRQQSKAWAVAQLKQAGLPTSTQVSGADVLGADFVGADVMGSWYNPFSWFANLIDVMFNGRAKQQMSTVGPDQSQSATDEYGNPVDSSTTDQSTQQSPDGTNTTEAYPADAAATAEAYPDGGAQMEAYPDASSQGDLLSGISGDDSLGAVAQEILAGVTPIVSKPNKPVVSKEDQMMQIAVKKLRSGNPIAPGELAIISRLASAGHPLAKKLYATLLAGGVTKISGSDSGAWVHKLSPAYWFKSSEEKKLVDIEKDKWKENAELQKQLGKRQVVLDQAERAKAAAEAVRVAKEQAAATEAQLKAISASISGVLIAPAKSDSMGASFVGHEKPTPIAKVVLVALTKAGKKDRAAAIYAKIISGKSLDAGELADSREIIKILQNVKVVHGDLHQATPAYLTAVHGAFVGGCLQGNIEMALQKNKICGKAATVLGQQIDGRSPLTPANAKSLHALCQKTSSLRNVVTSHASSKVANGLEQGKDLQKSIIVGAIGAAMSPAEAKMIEAMQKLAKAGNPRALEGLKRLKASGAIVGGDHIGFSVSEAFKYATAPVWLPAKALAKGAKWVGQKTGIVSKGGSSPEQQRLSMMKAAAQRRKAAAAKAAAADAQTQAELRAQQAIADAADAEADAADAESLAKEAAMRTKEVEADPSQYTSDESGADAFIGKEDAAIVGKAKAQDATGVKIRSGMALYKKAKAGDPAAKAAIVKMVAKAKKGDQQAVKDVRAVQAGMRAVKAQQKAQKKQARVLVAKARKAKVRAVQKKLEAAVANKLVRIERKHELKKLAKVERKAAAGNKSAKAYIVKQVTLAKKGDKKAAVRVQKLRLVKNVRKAAPTTSERRNLAAAGSLYAKAQKGNPKAVRQIMVLQDAANKGNPNAKRAVKRLQVAKAVAAAITTGAVTSAVLTTKKGKKQKMTKAHAQELVAKAKSKAAARSGSREELAAGARAAQALGDKKTAGTLAVAASQAPSATETLKKTATVVAAKEAGNPEAKTAINASFEAAKSGDAAEIKKMGNVLAAQTIDDVNKGNPVPPAMRDAVNLQERIAAKDPVAMETAKQIAEAATSESPAPEAVAAAISLAAAGVTAKAMAAKPAARKEFLEKVNPPLSAAEATVAEQKLSEYMAKAKDGTITPEEGVVAERLAERMNKPKVAAQIAAMAPPAPPTTPLSSLPDMAQPPITGVLSLLKESLRALTFTTRDPLANWREGVSTRAARSAKPVVPLAGNDESGWSPFDWVRKNLSILMPTTALAASAASLATSIAAKRQSGKPAPAPAPAPAAVAPAAPAAPEAPAAVVAEKPVTSSGAAPAVKTFKDYVSEALAAKKMSKGDFNRAVEAQTGRDAAPQTKTAVGQKMLEFLTSKGIKIDV